MNQTADRWLSFHFIYQTSEIERHSVTQPKSTKGPNILLTSVQFLCNLAHKHTNQHITSLVEVITISTLGLDYSNPILSSRKRNSILLNVFFKCCLNWGFMKYFSQRKYEIEQKRFPSSRQAGSAVTLGSVCFLTSSRLLYLCKGISVMLDISQEAVSTFSYKFKWQITTRSVFIFQTSHTQEGPDAPSPTGLDCRCV